MSASATETSDDDGRTVTWRLASATRDGVVDRLDATVDENVFGFVVSEYAGKLSDIGEAVDLAIADPAPEIVKVETGAEDRVFDFPLLQLDEALNRSILKASSLLTSR